MAQFDAVSFCRSVAQIIHKTDGCRVYEKTRVVDVTEALVGPSHKVICGNGKTVFAKEVGMAYLCHKRLLLSQQLANVFFF